MEIDPSSAPLYEMMAVEPDMRQHLRSSSSQQGTTLDAQVVLEDDAAAAPADPEPQPAGTNTKPPKFFLRTLPSSARYIWQDTHSKQLDLFIEDKRSMAIAKKLPQNATLTMALNEVVFSHPGGGGFFLHLKNRESWTQPDTVIFPKSRHQELPKADFPTMLYHRFSWNDASRASFLASSHCSRYPTCDGMLNPLASYVPVYAIQYLHYCKYAVYKTSVESLIVIGAPDTYYLCTTVEYQNAVGKWSASRPPAPTTPDPDMRLPQAPCLWREAKTAKERNVQPNMRPYRVEALYREIVSRCVPEKLAATFSAGEFLWTIPRPMSPELGISLGAEPNLYRTNPDSTTRTSNARSRKWRPLPGRGGLRPAREGHQTRGEKREKKGKSS